MPGRSLWTMPFPWLSSNRCGTRAATSMWVGRLFSVVFMQILTISARVGGNFLPKWWWNIREVSLPKYPTKVQLLENGPRKCCPDFWFHLIYGSSNRIKRPSIWFSCLFSLEKVGVGWCKENKAPRCLGYIYRGWKILPSYVGMMMGIIVNHYKL